MPTILQSSFRRPSHKLTFYHLTRDDFSLARDCLARLLPLRSSSDPEVALQVDLLSIDLEVKQRNLSTALQQTNDLLALSKYRLHVSGNVFLKVQAVQGPSAN